MKLTSVGRERDILHVVSFSLPGDTIRLSGVPSSGNLLIWWDSLITGPVTETTLERLSPIRSRYLKNAGAPALRVLGCDVQPEEVPSLAARDRLVRRSAEWREIALWFGPSVEEQLSLLQIVAALAQQDLGKTKLSLVSCPYYPIAAWNPEQLAQFFKSRVAIHSKYVRFCSRAWSHFCEPDPMPLFRFVQRNTASNPNSCAALALQLREYPSVRNGLSALETMLLREVPERGTVVLSVAHVMCSDGSGCVGDWILFEMMWRFLTCEVPLIEPAEGSMQDIDSWWKFRKLPIRLTPVAHRLLRGRTDCIALNGIDRWIGGVHLAGRSVSWRWDTASRVLKRVPAAN